MSCVNLNEKVFSEKLSKCQYSDCVELLKNEFKLFRNDENKLMSREPSEATLILIADTLEELYKSIEKDEIAKLLLVQQIYQSLRNSCVCGNTVQNNIVKNEKLIDDTKKYLIYLTKKEDESHTNCLKMLLQFLCNLVVNNSFTQEIIKEKCFSSLKEVLSEEKTAHITTMVIYNILKDTKSLELDTDFVCAVLKMIEQETENIILIFELLVIKNIITNTYRNLDTHNRVTALEYISHMQTQETLELPTELLFLMCDVFKKGSDCILKTVTDYLNNIEPIEVARLLDCLATASSNTNTLPILQKDKSLFINCAFLLRSIHSAGKESDNDFTAIQKLSELKLVDSSVHEHPAFGFKASLIRILGNLCWKHEENQNLIRELDCIPLLMDCCNIDGRNPLIIQWVILAVRNITENNDENKRTIAEMTKIGVVNTSTLREMGLALHDDGSNKIFMMPLDVNK